MNGARKIWVRSRGLVRFARHLRGFLAHPISPSDAAAEIARGVADREARFLGKLDSVVFASAANPYRQLLDAAGCEYGDAERLVRTEGLDGALTVLAARGVQLSFDEFKGRIPVVRGSRTFHFQPEDFDDPTFHAEGRGRTGGSTGPPITFGWSFALSAQWAPHWCLFFAANEAIGAPLIFWTPGHTATIGAQLACAKFGQRFDHWFVSQEMTRLVDRAYAGIKHWICRRLAGFPVARPVAYHDTGPVLACVLDRLKETRRVSVNTTPSAAVRLSLAAREQAADLTGVHFLLGAEPLTPARRLAIEASGARATPLYGSTEAVWTGGQCPFPRQPDEVHVLRDLHAVIPAAGPDEAGGGEASRILFTSLAPLTSKVILNTDIGDRGVIGNRRCECLYDRIGCTQTIHTIRSADKLTEYGVTISVADVYHVLEHVLPHRYGAVAGDFQLVETRTADGLPRYVLLVHPRLQDIDGRALARHFLAELGQQGPYYGFMTTIWEREQVLEVRRQLPVATGRGKQLPFLRLSDPRALPGEPQPSSPTNEAALDPRSARA